MKLLSDIDVIKPPKNFGQPGWLAASSSLLIGCLLPKCKYLARTAIWSGVLAAMLLSGDLAKAVDNPVEADGNNPATRTLTVPDASNPGDPAGTYSTTANNAPPVFWAHDGGTITATGTTTVPIILQSSGNSTIGVLAEGSDASNNNSTITLQNFAIITNGGSLYGAEALGGGAITMTDGSIATSNASAHAIVSDGQGSSVIATSVNIATISGSAYGAVAQNGGAIELHGGILTSIDSNSGGASARGLYADGVGSNITADQGAAISSTGVGAYAINGGVITLDAISVQDVANNQNYASGIRADGAGSMVTANNISINLTTDFADGGGLAYAGGYLNIQNSGITTSGALSFGLQASLVDSATNPATLARIDATNVTIMTTGDSGSGVMAYAGAFANLNNVEINTAGQWAYGLAADGYLDYDPSKPVQTEIKGTNVKIQTTGVGGYGAVITAGGVLDLTDSSISTTELYAGGVYVSDPGSSATFTNTPVKSAQYNAGHVDNSALYLTGYDLPVVSTSLHVTNSDWSGGRYGIYSTGGMTDAPNIVTFNGGSLLSAKDALRAEGTVAAIELTNTTVAPQNNIFVNALLADVPTAFDVNGDPTDFVPVASIVELTMSKVTATGNAIADAASTLNMTLHDGTKWTGAALNVTNITIDDSPSTWTMNASSTVSRTVTNNGMIAFAPLAAGDDPTLRSNYKTLATTNYVGNGGTISLNTYLGDDSSPSDKLVIDGGTATGKTYLHITNTGGPGALTISNGILVVDTINGGTTAADAFKLDTGTRGIVAGPYEYKLFRGGADAGNDNWYLRSQVEAEPPPSPGTTPDPGPPSDPGLTPPKKPLYRPEVGAYLANRRLAGILFEQTLHDRIGEQPQGFKQQRSSDTVAKNDAAAPETGEFFTDGYYGKSDEKRSPLWLRLIGKDITSRSGDGNFDVDSNQFLLQGGADIGQWSVFSNSDLMHLGVMLSYGWASTTASALDNTAKAEGDVQGVSAGVYGTWFQNGDTRLGWYTDLWAQYGWFTNHVRGEDLPAVKYDSRSLALSAEAGYAKDKWLPFGWIIEPEGQLIYLYNNQDDFTEANGTRVSSDNGGNWISRLGLRFHRTWRDDSGLNVQPYLTLNWWHDSTNNSISFDQIAIGNLYPQNRYEIKLGVNMERDRGWSAWGDIGGQIGGQEYRALVGRVGIKYSW